MDGKRSRSRSQGQSSTMCRMAQENVLPAMMAVIVTIGSEYEPSTTIRLWKAKTRRTMHSKR
eukprot:10644258-Karenia_brevis.AAC.1